MIVHSKSPLTKDMIQTAEDCNDVYGEQEGKQFESNSFLFSIVKGNTLKWPQSNAVIEIEKMEVHSSFEKAR